MFFLPACCHWQTRHWWVTHLKPLADYSSRLPGRKSCGCYGTAAGTPAGSPAQLVCKAEEFRARSPCRMGQKANSSTADHINRKAVFISQTCSVKLTWTQAIPWTYNINIANINDSQLTSVSSLCCEMELWFPRCNARRSTELTSLRGTSSEWKKRKFSMTKMNLKH